MTRHWRYTVAAGSVERMQVPLEAVDDKDLFADKRYQRRQIEGLLNRYVREASIITHIKDDEERGWRLEMIRKLIA